MGDSENCRVEREANKGEKGENGETSHQRNTEVLDEQNSGVNVQMLIQAHRIDKLEVSDQEPQGFTAEEASSQFKVGKMRISSKQIKEVTLNLEVLEKVVVIGDNEAQSKVVHSSACKKRGARELRNLECSIDFDKGRKDNGLQHNS